MNWDKIVFQGETWFNQNTCPSRGVTDGIVKANSGNPVGKGSRLIVCHAGGVKGWINAPLLIFASKSTKDFHEEMNAEKFEK